MAMSTCSFTFDGNCCFRLLTGSEGARPPACCRRDLRRAYVTPLVLRPKQITKPCREHHVYVIMLVMEGVDNIFVTSDDQ